MELNSTEARPAMTDSPSSAFFDNLPTEMKVNVFAFVRTKADQKAVCLVSNEWNALMAPMLWDILASQFRPTSTMSLTTLLRPGNNILPHVKKIYVGRSQPDPSDKSCDTTVEAVLRFVVGALPNALYHFTSDMTLSSSFVMYLLQSQPTLKIFHGRWERSGPEVPSEIASVGQATWLAPTIRQLRQLTLYVDHECTLNRDDCRFLIQHARCLETLDIRGFKGKPSVELSSKEIFGDLEAIDGTPTKFLHLSRLLLCNVEFGIAPTTIFSHIDFSALKILTIVRCSQAPPFLEALVAYYSRAPCKLNRLDVMLRDHRRVAKDAAVQALERLLDCIPPLCSLTLDPGAEKHLNVACFVRHGSRLRNLLLGNARTMLRPYLSYSALTKLLHACPELRQLAVALPPIEMGPIERAGSEFVLGASSQLPQTELESALVRAVAHSEGRRNTNTTLGHYRYRSETPYSAHFVPTNHRLPYATEPGVRRPSVDR